jgi:predicted RNase H-like nuclease
MRVAVGINGCSDGWFYFRFDGELAIFGACASIAEIIAGLPADACVLVAVPIGLRARGKAERDCDLAVRELLGPRRTTAVPAPLRPVLKAADYASAQAQTRRLSGRGLSRQSWQLVPKVREVDDLLRHSEQARSLLRESHPELLFAGLAGGPMSHASKTRDGFTERMTILSILHPDAERLVASAFLAHGGFEASRDEIVDAFVLALAARQPLRLQGLPAEPQTDPHGLPMQTWYLPGHRQVS